MHNGVYISASLMCVDWLKAGEQIQELEESGCDYLHLDIIDGNFAPDFTMGSSIIDVFKEHTSLVSDYHLMVEEPSRLFDSFSITENNIFTIHQECSRNLHRDIISLREKGARVGVALSPGTSLDTLEYIIEDLDVILLMTVNPGYKGQPLVPQAIKKISNLKKIINEMNLKTQISVDGNVNSNTIPEMVSSGADILVLGSSGLFRNDISISDAVEKIKSSIDEGKK